MHRSSVTLILIVAVGCSFSLAACTHTPGGSDEGYSDAARSQVDAVLLREVRERRTPSISVVVVKNGIIRYSGAVGYRDMARGLPATQDTVYAIGSITKQFTAAAVLVLVQEHRLRLDDRLSRYVPEYRFASRITIRNLLNQVSGIPDYSDFHEGRFSENWDWSSFVAFLNLRPLQFSPGFIYNSSS